MWPCMPAPERARPAASRIPNCFAWQGSLVVLDVKREAFNATAGHRAAMGQRIFLFDPAAEDGRSHRWDPFTAIRRESPERFDQIARMGFQLFPEHYAGPGNASADRFWEPAGRAAFVAVATLLSETPDEALTMANVLRVFTRGDGIEWLARKIEGRRNTNRHYSRVVADGVSDYINGDIRQVDGIRKTVTTRLQVWHNPRIAAATECKRLRRAGPASATHDNLCGGRARRYTTHGSPTPPVLRSAHQPQHGQDTAAGPQHERADARVAG